jgi:hypothetical protein
MDWDGDLTIAFNACDVDTGEFEEEFYGSRPELSFELALMEAQIKHAIYERDLAWVNDVHGLERRDYIHSFRNCCDHLGIDYRAARKILNQRLRKKSVLAPRAQPNEALRFEIVDVPGKTYSHAYGECPSGVIRSKCPECRQRYSYRYTRLWRKTARLRTPVAAVCLPWDRTLSTPDSAMW